MADISLIPADRVPVAERAALMNAAYADYFVPMHLTADLVRSMDRFYDVDLPGSVVAYEDGEPVGTVLLSRREDRGWVSGVGVVPHDRRRGIGRCMMEAVLDRAQRDGLRTVTLEVIAQNAAARALYGVLGFALGRELLCWRRPADADPLPVPGAMLAEASVGDALVHCDAWSAEPRCWQLESRTLHRMAHRLRGYRLDLRGAAAGYCLLSDYGDAVALMAVGLAPQVDAPRAGLTMLQALAHLYRGRALTTTNLPADDGLSRVLAALRFLVTVRQVEMRLAFGS